MLSETLDRVNQRRQQAMSDPQYQEAAGQHAKAIAQSTPHPFSGRLQRQEQMTPFIID